MDLSEARIRLEGALERLEAIEPGLEKLRAHLESPLWRTELAPSTQIAEVLRALPAFDEGLGRAHRLLRQEHSAELEGFITRIEATRTKLLALVHERTGEPLELGPGLEVVQRKAREELPRPLEQTETVVLSGRLGFFSRGSRYELTTRRLVLRTKREDPREVPLSAMVPGSVRTNLLTCRLELKAPELVRVRAVHGLPALARQLELERWLASVGAGPPGKPPRWKSAVVPYRGLHQQDSKRVGYPTRTLLLTPSRAVLLRITPNAGVGGALSELVGAFVYAEPTLEQFCDVLERCEPAQAEDALQPIIKLYATRQQPRETLLRLHGYFNSIGIEMERGNYWFDPVGYAQSEKLRELLQGREFREVGKPGTPLLNLGGFGD